MTPSPASILGAIEKERDALRAFVALLEREQQILLAPDTAPLLELADEKSRLADTLAACTGKRRQQLPAGQADVELRLKEVAPGAVDTWRELVRLATQAGDLNRHNGELIRVRARYNQQALHALIGASRQATDLYGANGQPSLAGSGRALGSG